MRCSGNAVNLCVCMCVYVCKYVHVYACVYACMYVCMHVCMYVRTCASMCECVYVCMYVCVCVGVWGKSHHSPNARLDCDLVEVHHGELHVHVVRGLGWEVETDVPI